MNSFLRSISNSSHPSIQAAQSYPSPPPCQCSHSNRAHAYPWEAGQLGGLFRVSECLLYYIGESLTTALGLLFSKCKSKKCNGTAMEDRWGTILPHHTPVPPSPRLALPLATVMPSIVGPAMGFQPLKWPLEVIWQQRKALLTGPFCDRSGLWCRVRPIV